MQISNEKKKLIPIKIKSLFAWGNNWLVSMQVLNIAEQIKLKSTNMIN